MILWKQCSISFSIFSASDPRLKGLNVTVSSTCLRNSSNHGLEFSRAVVSGSSAGRFKSRDGFEVQWARFVISGMPKPKRSSFSTVPMPCEEPEVVTKIALLVLISLPCESENFPVFTAWDRLFCTSRSAFSTCSRKITDMGLSASFSAIKGNDEFFLPHAIRSREMEPYVSTSGPGVALPIHCSASGYSLADNSHSFFLPPDPLG
nr:hypothetical protein Iba_chr02cCG17280 [Ipomoea batatas]